MPLMPVQTVATGLSLLEFSSSALTIRRGTYVTGAVCIKPATGRFAADVSASPTNAAFKLLPASVSAKMGDSSGCADMGTASGTRATTHTVYWKVENGTTKYSALPPTMVKVTNE